MNMVTQNFVWGGGVQDKREGFTLYNTLYHVKEHSILHRKSLDLLFQFFLKIDILIYLNLYSIKTCCIANRDEQWFSSFIEQKLMS